MPELKDSRTGEVITPDQITAQLANQGITDNVKVQAKVSESPKAEATEKKAEATEKKEETLLKAEVEVKSSVEEEAVNKGWKPDGPKSAEEFLRAEPLYDEIKARGKEIKELKQTLDEVKNYMSKQQELGYNKALEELKQDRSKAISLGDESKVNAIDEQIKDTESQLPESNDVHPIAQDFMTKNASWINDPSYEAQQAREFAHKRDQELAAYNLDPQEHIKVIEKDLKQKFPKLLNAESEVTTQVSAVESDAAPVKQGRRKKVSFSDLSPEQKQCARHFEKRGIMSGEAYIKSLVESGEI